MAGVTQSLDSLHLLDGLAEKKSIIHRVHPLSKLLVTFIYLVVLVSFDKYEITGLLSLFFYPVILFSLADIPVLPMIKRLLVVEPLLLGIGILNPLLESHTITFWGFTLSQGWLTFASIILKGSLAVTASLLLVATTGMNRIAAALRMLRIPPLFILQLLLLYRYIWVLMEEVGRVLRAYSLRAPRQKGVHPSVWGSLAGQLLLRTLDRAQRVYQSMCLRGFRGEFPANSIPPLRLNDWGYTLGWTLFFILARLVNLPALMGLLFTGGI